MTKKADHGIEAGQYWAVKVRGTGGDLVLGRVISIRTNNDDPLVVSENLLNGRLSTKKASVMLKRNGKISKRQAMKFLRMKEGKTTNQEIREAIVKFWKAKTKPKATRKKSQPAFDFSLPNEEQMELKKKLTALTNKFIEDVLKLVEEK